ncbi:MAG: hypothetical protein ACTHKB_15780 [Burkholderiaceae bacterium]
MTPINGAGMVLIDYLLTAFVWLSLLLCAAIVRAPDVVETNMQQVARRIKTAGLFILACRFTYVMATDGDILISVPSMIGLLLLLLAVCLASLCRLFPSVNELDEAQAARTIAEYQAEIARMQKFIDSRKGRS